MKQALAAALLALALPACQQLPNVAPTAAFVYSPVSPIFGGQTVVTMDANASSDSDGHIAAYLWSFGDGTADETLNKPVTTHVFPAPAGCYERVVTVQLAVSDDTGLRGFASQQVTIQPPPGAAGCVAAGR